MFDVGSIAEVIPVQPKNWFTVLSVYVIVLIPEIIVPDGLNPIVESTDIVDDPIDTDSTVLVFAVISKLPSTNDVPSYPINNENLKYFLLFLRNDSTSETEATVSGSFSFSIFLIVCPTNPIGLPLRTSAMTTSLLKYRAEDGLISNSSKLTTFGSTPYKTLNKVSIAASVPFVS